MKKTVLELPISNEIEFVCISVQN